MSKRAGLSICIVCLVLSGIVSGQDYIADGRSHMFQRTLSGLRLAYETFDSAIEDPTFENTDELLFLHAVTRTAMLFIRTDGGEINSFQKLADQFGIEITGDSFDPDPLDLHIPLNNRDHYEIPKGAPDAEQISLIAKNWLIPELEEIIETLEMIEDSAENRFAVYFCPSETNLEKDMQVSYGEVLLLKGILSAMKAQLTALPAYDLHIEDIDEVVQKLYGNAFSINEDLLDPNPYFLKVLPTINDPNIGKDTLAAAAQGMIDSINYYVNSLDYLKTLQEIPLEEGTERFLYIGPDEMELADIILANLIKLRNSLISDTSAVYDIETAKTYHLTDEDMNIWSLVLKYDMLEMPIDSGSLEISGGDVLNSWEIENIYDEGGIMWIYLRSTTPGMWAWGEMRVQFNHDRSSIIDASLSYWSDQYVFIENLSGNLEYTHAEQLELDLNPIYGSTGRYPEPVSPRDLLPEFDKWNEPLPGTIAKGLSYDPTLGGIVPQMSHSDWQSILNWQPSGTVYLNEIYSWQISYGTVGFWFDNQIIFDDPVPNANIDAQGNLDIKRLYMGYNHFDSWGEIIFHDGADWGSSRAYELVLNYSKDKISGWGEIRDAIKLQLITLENNQAEMRIYKWAQDDWWGYWEQISHNGTAWLTSTGIQFRFDLAYDIPGFLPGRFITLRSFSVEDWYWQLAEENSTRLQLGRLGNIHGNISFHGWQGQPVFIEAYTDPHNPEESRVSTTMLSEPGSFTLEGIGLGWQGYIRAYTPIFGFDNIFELGCLELEDLVEVYLWQENLYGVDLALSYPEIIRPCQGVAGYFSNDNIENFYSFDAIEGAKYTFHLDSADFSGAAFTLYSRDAQNKHIEYYYWDGNELTWYCDKPGRYFVKISTSESLGSYTFTMNSDAPDLIADVSSHYGIGIKDGKVDFYDLMAMTEFWLQECSGPHWRSGLDLNQSGRVDFVDFAVLSREWIE